MRERFFRHLTGHGSAYWMRRVQKYIWQSVTAVDDEFGVTIVHPDCDLGQWLRRLADDVEKAVKEQEKASARSFDGNIRGALIMGTVLLTWALRISRSKAYDPNRPLALRQMALASYQANLVGVLDSLTDESMDHKYFPQEFNPPHGPQARGGDFV